MKMTKVWARCLVIPPEDARSTGRALTTATRGVPARAASPEAVPTAPAPEPTSSPTSLPSMIWIVRLA